MRYTLLVIVLLLSACNDKETGDSFNVIDQCLRQSIFQACLKAVPTGPTHTVASNDWDEVVEACESAAYYQSIQTRNGRKDDNCIRRMR